MISYIEPTWIGGVEHDSIQPSSILTYFPANFLEVNSLISPIIEGAS